MGSQMAKCVLQHPGKGLGTYRLCKEPEGKNLKNLVHIFLVVCHKHKKSPGVFFPDFSADFNAVLTGKGNIHKIQGKISAFFVQIRKQFFS